MKSKLPRVAVIGAGYWGKNLVRNFSELGALAVVCDTSVETLCPPDHTVRFLPTCLGAEPLLPIRFGAGPAVNALRKTNLEHRAAEQRSH